MKLTELSINGAFLIDNFRFSDHRGEFVKVFNHEVFKSQGILETDFREVYYSKSKKGVIRGMHFQAPPADHAKLVFLLSGRVRDVLLDLRTNGGVYGAHLAIDLQADQNAIYIPRGIAHGFRALEDDSVMLYCQTTGYHRGCDSGIHYNSFGCDWGGTTDPVISDRDTEFVSFQDFNSPF